MKLSKLSARGFAHHFLLALIVVGVAIGGTYYIVFSKADTFAYQNGRVWYNYYQSFQTQSILPDGTKKENDPTTLFGPTPYAGVNELNFSDDGKKLTYQAPVTNTDQWASLLIRDVNSTSDSTVLVRNKPILWNAISPDKQKVAYHEELEDSSGSVNGDAIGLVNADGTGNVRLHSYYGDQSTKSCSTNQPTGITWLKDSSAVIYLIPTADDVTKVCKITTDGKITTLRTIKKVGTYFRIYSLSNDGNTMLMRGDKGGTAGNVFTASLTGTDLTQVTHYTTNDKFVQSVTWSPDGTKIAYLLSSYTTQSAINGLHVMDAAGTNDVRIDDGGNMYAKVVWQPISPVTPPATSLACTIEGVPSNPAYGKTFTPKTIYTNTGTTTIPAHTVSRGIGDGSGPGSGANIDLPALAPGQTYTDTWGTSTVQYADSQISHLIYGSSGSNPDFSCEAVMTLPVQQTATYKASCTIAMADHKAVGQPIFPNLTVRSIGNSPLVDVRTTRIEYRDMVTGRVRPVENVQAGTIGVGQVRTAALGQFTVKHTSRMTVEGVAANGVVFGCNATVLAN